MGRSTIALVHHTLFALLSSDSKSELSPSSPSLSLALPLARLVLLVLVYSTIILLLWCCSSPPLAARPSVVAAHTAHVLTFHETSPPPSQKVRSKQNKPEKAKSLTS